MEIEFAGPYGSSLTNRINAGLPSIGVGNGTWILVRNTVKGYFRDLKDLTFFVASSVTCALTLAAFIRDVPTIVATVEQISLGALSVWTAQSRAALLTHLVSYYFWPIGINLLRGFFLALVGAVVISIIALPMRYYRNISTYNTQKNLAIEHVQQIQLISSAILQLIPGEKPNDYLAKALKLFESDQEDKVLMFNKVQQQIQPDSTTVEHITEKACNSLAKAIGRQIHGIDTEAAYQQLRSYFAGATDQRECTIYESAPINQFIAQTLTDNWSIGKEPKECLKQLIKGFMEPKFEGGTLQLLTLLRQEEGQHPEAFKVGALYKLLIEHKKGYEAAVKEMKKIYDFKKTELEINTLWQPLR